MTDYDYLPLNFVNMGICQVSFLFGWTTELFDLSMRGRYMITSSDFANESQQSFSICFSKSYILPRTSASNFIAASVCLFYKKIWTLNFQPTKYAYLNFPVYHRRHHSVFFCFLRKELKLLKKNEWICAAVTYRKMFKYVPATANDIQRESSQ